MQVKITKYNNLIRYPEVEAKDLAEIVRRYNFPKYERAKRLAKLYIKWGDKFQIYPLLAWPQAMHETGFLAFEGIVPESANNFCGHGATGAEGVYNVFETEELGVIAHYSHLAWYCYPEHYDLKDEDGDLYCSKKYDIRHFGTKHRYNVFNLEQLGGKWATPGYTYGEAIAKIATQILNIKFNYKSNATNKIRDYLNQFKKKDWKHVAIHHTVSNQFTTTMDKIKSWHKARGFIREGYNFGINGKGEIEFGRPLNMAGAHMRGWNTSAVGVALYGDFRYDKLTQGQEDRLIELLSTLGAVYDIPNSNILGHRQFKGQYTLCPGKNILKEMNRIKDLIF